MKMIEMSDAQPTALEGWRVFAGGRAEPLFGADRASGVLYRWLHLRLGSAQAERWLEKDSGLDPLVTKALMAAETRPRFTKLKNGLLLNLRGVNLNPGAAIEDMVSLRLWVDERQVISVRLRDLKAVQDLRDSLDEGRAPASSGEFLVRIVGNLTDRMEPPITTLSDLIDTLEDMLLGPGADPAPEQIAEVRRRILILLRFLEPQRSAISSLGAQAPSFINDEDRRNLLESVDRVTRLTEALTMLKDRAGVIKDQIDARRGEALNRRMLVLSIATAVFLPLNFLTSLFGMNVAGLPWTQNPLGFVWVSLIAVLVTAGMVLGVRYVKWLS